MPQNLVEELRHESAWMLATSGWERHWMIAELMRKAALEIEQLRNAPPVETGFYIPPRPWWARLFR